MPFAKMSKTNRRTDILPNWVALETAIRKSIAMFGAMHEEYYQMFYLLSDHRGIEKWYYNTTSSVLHTRDLEKAKEICYQYLELLKRVNKIFDLRVFYEKGSNGVQGVQTRLKRKDRFESK